MDEETLKSICDSAANEVLDTVQRSGRGLPPQMLVEILLAAGAALAVASQVPRGNAVAMLNGAFDDIGEP